MSFVSHKNWDIFFWDSVVNILLGKVTEAFQTRRTTRSCRDPETAVSPRQARACPVGRQRRAAAAASAAVAVAADVCRQGGSF